MAGLSNYLRNKLVDWLLRGQAFTPPANVYIELCSTAPGPGVAGLPLSGTGYARVAIPSGLANWSGTQGDGSTVPSSGTTGTTSNNAEVDFGLAGGNWGTASHWEMYDAPTGGNRLVYGTIVNGVGTPTPRDISTGDPVSFPISSLRIQFS